MPKKWALIVVDYQNDFVSGSLAVGQGPARQDPLAILPNLNKLLSMTDFAMTVLTYDWHPPEHISFVEKATGRPRSPSSPAVAPMATVTFTKPFRQRQTLWPSHCVQNSEGAKLHPGLLYPPSSVHIYKGVNPDIDSYSALFDNYAAAGASERAGTGLKEKLEREKVTGVIVCGLASEVCVAATAGDAREIGLETVLVEDASAGLNQEHIRIAWDKLRDKSVRFARTKDIPEIISAQ